MRNCISVLAVLSLMLTSAVDLLAQTAATDRSERIGGGSPSLTVAPRAVVREGARLGPTASPQTTPERSWPGRHPVLLGALVGFGAGVAFIGGTAHAQNGCMHSSDYTCPQMGLWFGGLGAGIGAGVGGIVALVRR